MTVEVSLTACDAIAKLIFPGVTVKTIATIPANGVLSPRILYPDPTNGLFATTNIPQLSQGSQGSEAQNFEYDIFYRYLHCAPIGSVSGLGYSLQDVVKTVKQIIKVFSTNDSLPDAGVVDLRLIRMSPRWPITVKDPAGNDFIGCDFVLHAIEFIS